jgi:hypothetical protein
MTISLVWTVVPKALRSESSMGKSLREILQALTRYSAIAPESPVNDPAAVHRVQRHETETGRDKPGMVWRWASH